MRWPRHVRKPFDPFGDWRLAEIATALREPEGHTPALVSSARKPQSAEYNEAVAAMARWPPELWLRLDAARLDSWSSYPENGGPSPGWSKIVAEASASTLLLVLATTHRDGFLRERAVRVVAERPEVISAAALALRAIDHVPQVREVARELLAARVSAPEAGIAIPILLAAHDRSAGPGAFEDYVRELPTEVLSKLVASVDARTRRYAIEHAPLGTNDLVQIACSDADTRTRLLAARRAIGLDETAATTLLEAKASVVRSLAISVAPESAVAPILDQVLLARGTLLRRAAQSRVRSLGREPAEVYRRHLPERIGVVGLGETGIEADVSHLEPLVGSAHSAPVRRATVAALSRLGNRDTSLALLEPLLDDEEPTVAREAARQLRRLEFRPTAGALDAWLESASSWRRRMALDFAVREHGWNAVVAALALFSDPDDDLRHHAGAILRQWLGRRAASAGRPSEHDLDRIRRSLNRANAAPDLARLVRFHAGL